MVMVAVETDRDPVEVAAPRIAPLEPRRDRRPVVEHRSDIDRVIVKDHAEFGTLGPGLSLRRVFLDELGDGRRLHPHGLIEPAVDIDRGLHSKRPGPGNRLVIVIRVDRRFLGRLGAAPLAGPDRLGPDVQRVRKQGGSDENEPEEESQSEPCHPEASRGDFSQCVPADNHVDLPLQPQSVELDAPGSAGGGSPSPTGVIRQPPCAWPAKAPRSPSSACRPLRMP